MIFYVPSFIVSRKSWIFFFLREGSREGERETMM